MEFIPKFIRRTEDKRAAEKIKNIDWNELFNLLITQGDWNTQALVDLVATLETYSTTSQTVELINQRVAEIGSSDMMQDKYDSNGDGVVNKADAVGVDGVTTESIVDGSVTLEKLDGTLAKKLNYCYSNIGSLIVQVGGKDQISGSADLNLFGLDGTLSTGYNIYTETINHLLNAAGYVIGSFAIPHRLQNASSLLKTGTNYTISNKTKVFKTQLSTITNAVLTKRTDLQQDLPIVDDDTSISYDGSIIHLRDNTYIVGVNGWFENKHDVDISTTTFYKIDFDGTKVTKTQLHAASYEDLYEAIRMGDYVHFLGENWDVYGATNFEDFIFSYGKDNKFYVRGVDVESPVQSDQYTFASDGSMYYRYYDRADGHVDISRMYLSNSEKTIIDIDEDGYKTDLDISQLSGHWARIYTDESGSRVYYLLDMLTATTYPLSASHALKSMNPDAFDADGEHFYYNGAKYTIEPVTRELVKVCDIKNYNLGSIAGKVPIVNNNVYRIGSAVWYIEHNTCVKAYTAPAGGAYTCAPGGSLNRGMYLAGTKNVQAIPYTYQDGAIVLTNTGPETISGEIYITRNQDCNVPKGKTKHIYLKPTIQNKTYNTLNMILYFDRDVKSTDKIVVTVNGTTVNPLSASTATIKYYETSFTATKNIEVIISVTAGSTGALQVTQILGGVDNEV